MCNEPGSEGSAGAKKQELRGKREGEGDDFGDLRAKNTLFVKTCGKVGNGCSFCVRPGVLWCLARRGIVSKCAETGRLQFLCKVSEGRNGTAAGEAAVFV